MQEDVVAIQYLHPLEMVRKLEPGRTQAEKTLHSLGCLLLVGHQTVEDPAATRGRGSGVGDQLQPGATHAVPAR